MLSINSKTNNNNININNNNNNVFNNIENSINQDRLKFKFNLRKFKLKNTLIENKLNDYFNTVDLNLNYIELINYYSLILDNKIINKIKVFFENIDIINNKVMQTITNINNISNISLNTIYESIYSSYSNSLDNIIKVINENNTTYYNQKDLIGKDEFNNQFVFCYRSYIYIINNLIYLHYNIKTNLNKKKNYMLLNNKDDYTNFNCNLNEFLVKLILFLIKVINLDFNNNKDNCCSIIALDNSSFREEFLCMIALCCHKYYECTNLKEENIIYKIVFSIDYQELLVNILALNYSYERNINFIIFEDILASLMFSLLNIKDDANNNYSNNINTLSLLVEDYEFYNKFACIYEDKQFINTILSIFCSNNFYLFNNYFVKNLYTYDENINDNNLKDSYLLTYTNKNNLKYKLNFLTIIAEIDYNYINKINIENSTMDKIINNANNSFNNNNNNLLLTSKISKEVILNLVEDVIDLIKSNLSNDISYLCLNLIYYLLNNYSFVKYEIVYDKEFFEFLYINIVNNFLNPQEDAFLTVTCINNTLNAIKIIIENDFNSNIHSKEIISLINNENEINKSHFYTETFIDTLKEEDKINKCKDIIHILSNHENLLLSNFINNFLKFICKYYNNYDKEASNIKDSYQIDTLTSFILNIIKLVVKILFQYNNLNTISSNIKYDICNKYIDNICLITNTNMFSIIKSKLLNILYDVINSVSNNLEKDQFNIDNQNIDLINYEEISNDNNRNNNNNNNSNTFYKNKEIVLLASYILYNIIKITLIYNNKENIKKLTESKYLRYVVYLLIKYSLEEEIVELLIKCLNLYFENFEKRMLLINGKNNSSKVNIMSFQEFKNNNKKENKTIINYSNNANLNSNYIILFILKEEINKLKLVSIDSPYINNLNCLSNLYENIFNVFIEVSKKVD